jgi:threonine/homoserine/homoserine lactone efflux protein
MTNTTSSLTDHFLRGAMIGFSMAAPVGPIGVLCIRRSLTNGITIGFATGLGAATADALYGAVAAFGLTAVAKFLSAQQFWLALLGGGFLCWLGIRTFIAKPSKESADARRGNVFTAWASTLLLTITNPATILSFVALFAGFGINSSYATAGILVTGVFFGSGLWWLLLSTSVGSLRARFDARWIGITNRASGLVMFGFGVYALTRAL